MLKIAVIGTGWWGTELGKAAKGLPDLIALAGNLSLDPEGSNAFKKSFGGEIFKSYEQILGDKSIDAVLLATPHSTHHDLIVAAAAAGKHVMSEKPLTLDVASGRDAIAACEKAGVVLAVGHNRRFYKALRRMKQFVDDGECGKIIHIEANLSGNGGFRLQKGAWRADPNEVPNAGFTPMGIHLVDALTWMAGPIERVVAISKHQAIPVELDDTCAVLFEMKNGATGFIASNICVPRSCVLRLHGTKAKVELDDNFRQLTITAIDGTATVTTETDDSDATLLAEVAAFAAACAGTAPFPMPVREALRNVAFVEAIRKSATSGNSWVTVETV